MLCSLKLEEEELLIRVFPERQLDLENIYALTLNAARIKPRSFAQ
jgi:hypothetical protein